MKTLGELMIESAIRSQQWRMIRHVIYVLSAVACAIALVKLAFFSE